MDASPDFPGLQFLGLRVSISAGPPGQKIPKRIESRRAVSILRRGLLRSPAQLAVHGTEHAPRTAAIGGGFQAERALPRAVGFYREMRTVG